MADIYFENYLNDIDNIKLLDDFFHNYILDSIRIQIKWQGLSNKNIDTAYNDKAYHNAIIEKFFEKLREGGTDITAYLEDSFRELPYEKFLEQTTPTKTFDTLSDIIPSSVMGALRDSNLDLYLVHTIDEAQKNDRRKNIIIDGDKLYVSFKLNTPKNEGYDYDLENVLGYFYEYDLNDLDNSADRRIALVENAIDIYEQTDEEINDGILSENLCIEFPTFDNSFQKWVDYNFYPDNYVYNYLCEAKENGIDEREREFHLKAYFEKHAKSYLEHLKKDCENYITIPKHYLMGEVDIVNDKPEITFDRLTMDRFTVEYPNFTSCLIGYNNLDFFNQKDNLTVKADYKMIGSYDSLLRPRLTISGYINFTMLNGEPSVISFPTNVEIPLTDKLKDELSSAMDKILKQHTKDIEKDTTKKLLELADKVGTKKEEVPITHDINSLAEAYKNVAVKDKEEDEIER